MKFYQRAFQYVKCKKSKSILLFLCFLVLDISILCASMILQTAQETSASIQEKTGAKLVLECKGKYTIPIVLRQLLSAGGGHDFRQGRIRPSRHYSHDGD